MKLIIPTDYTEFLYWVKERTESLWSFEREVQKDEEYDVVNWAYGAKWIGLTEQKIDEVESKYGIKFTKFHRAFLKILHTVDKKRKYKGWDAEGNSVIREKPFFYNWLEDDIEIKNYLNWPKEFLLDDVLSGYIWLNSWGEKPNSKREQESIFKNWFNESPNLIPISGHRFVISKPLNLDNPILSVYGHDTIIYGRNMRHYLIHELVEELDLNQCIYDDELMEWDYELIPEIQQIHDFEYELLKTDEIPYWKEFLISNGFNEYLNKTKDNYK